MEIRSERLRNTCLCALLAATFAVAQSAYPSFLKAQGRSLVDASGKPVALRGVAFGNEVWSDARIPLKHHGAADYGRVASMGMNAVRFYLNYKTFEADGEPYKYLPDGWAWLDSNVAWAKRNRVYLMLNMHIPQGGFQSLGTGFGLWDVRSNQMRLAALWKAIAVRYRDEPAIASFDLLNEPGVSQNRSQWMALAQELADSIRTVDGRHLIIVERTNSVKGDWAEDAQRNWFAIRDANVAYTFHFYLPMEFTHQYASWIPSLREGGRYPDSSRLVFVTEPKWAMGSFQSPTLPAGTGEWAFFSGAKLRADSAHYAVAKPVIAAGGNAGTVWFDDLILREFDPGGALVRSIPLGLESDAGWDFWSADAKGTMASARTGCHGGAGCIGISGTSSDANASGNGERIAVTPGHSYALDGWMKGDGVSAGAQCRLRVDFESVEGGVLRRDKRYLAAQVDAYLAFGKEQNVPIYMGEFGAIDSAFRGGRGGLAWVSDMLDIAAERGLSFTYHCYHEDNFGIYRGYAAIDTNNANKDLIALFTRKLAGGAAVKQKGNREVRAGRSGSLLRRAPSPRYWIPGKGEAASDGRRIPE